MEHTETHEIKNDIMHTMLELGRTYMGEGELNLRIDWFSRCGSFLTPIEAFDLKIARGEKLSAYEKRNHKQLKQDYKDTRELIKELDKE